MKILDFINLKIENFSLDISESSLKALKIKKGKNSFSLDFLNELNIKPGIIKDGIVEDEKSLTEDIIMVCKKTGRRKLKTNYVVISLPEEGSFSQVFKMPKMKEDELKMAVALEAENYIPIPIDQAYVDFQIITPNEDDQDFLHILVVAMPKKIVDAYVSCIKNAGLIPVSIEVKSQSVSRALIKNGISDGPVALINFCDNKLDIVIFSKNSVHFSVSARLPLEDLNFVRGEVKNSEDAMVNVLVSQIKKYMNSYEEHAIGGHNLNSNNVKKIIFYGDCENFKKTADLISRKIGIEMEIGNPYINFPKQNKRHEIIKKPLNLVSALGLSLINFHEEDSYFLN